jgi:hypothetical protein
MKSITSAELQQNLDPLLAEIIDTGIPLEINYQGQRLRITPIQSPNKLDKLVSRPDVIVGDPEDLVGITWEQEVNGALLIELSDEPIAYAEQKNDVILHYSQENQLVLVEILDFCHLLTPETVQQLLKV